MITVPTHKRHKSSFKQSKTIYIFTTGRVIVTIQIHSRKKDFKGGNLNTAKWTSIHERRRIYAILMQDLMVVAGVGVEMH
jgi:hypothetical protein